jgi:hypothetical protein
MANLPAIRIAEFWILNGLRLHRLGTRRAEKLALFTVF